MSAADSFREARRQNEVIADAFAKAVAGFARLVRERQGVMGEPVALVGR